METKEIEEIEEIYTILGGSIEKNIIEFCYFENQCNNECTVDYLFGLNDAELLDLKSKLDSYSEKIQYDEDESNGHHVQESINYYPSSNTDMTTSTSNSKYSNVIDMLLYTFDNVDKAEIVRIVDEIGTGLEHSNRYSDDVLFAEAEDRLFLFQEMKRMYEEDDVPNIDVDSQTVDSAAIESVPYEVSTKRDFNSFVAMFCGVIKENRLKRLWKESLNAYRENNVAAECEGDEEELVDLAILNALDFLDSSEIKARDAQKHSDSQLAASLAAEDGFVPEMYAEELEESSLSTQQTLTRFVQELLAGMSFSDELVEQALEAFQYDMEPAIAHLLSLPRDASAVAKSVESVKSARMSDSPIRKLIAEPETSSKKRKEAFKPFPLQKPATVVVPGSLSYKGMVSSDKVAGVASVAKETAVQPASPLPNSKYVSLRNMPRSQLHFAKYFMDKFEKLNPVVKWGMSAESGLVEVLGFSTFKYQPNNADKTNASHLTIDLHGLSVFFAKQVVHASLGFFLKNKDSVIAEVNRQNGASTTYLMVKYIVGMGRHSANNIRKLAPAVVEYMRHERPKMHSVLVDGVVFVNV